MMEYIFKDKHYTLSGLLDFLYNYCFSHKRLDCFYLSRTFDIDDTDGNIYKLSFVFDKNERLEKQIFRRVGLSAEEQKALPVKKWKYFVSNANTENFFETKKELLDYLKNNPDVHYKLEDFTQNKTFGVKYLSESNMLSVNKKTFKI